MCRDVACALERQGAGLRLPPTLSSPLALLVANEGADGDAPPRRNSDNCAVGE
jgi:hypothetical protein